MLTVSSAPDSERRTPLGRSSCSVSIFRLVSFYPSGLLGWRLRSLSPIFPLSFSFGVFVTPRSMDEELEWAFPSGCSFFQLWGCPASAVAVAGIRGRVWRARPFFGTVFLSLFETLLLPYYAPQSLRRSGCACLGLRPCGKCLRLCLQKVP